MGIASRHFGCLDISFLNIELMFLHFNCYENAVILVSQESNDSDVWYVNDIYIYMMMFK